MLQITIPAQEIWNENLNVFENSKETTLQLEHSLISISKWESKWHKPFLLDTEQHTQEEMLDYVNCMVLTHVYDPDVLNFLTVENWSQINDYINDKMTATTFSKLPPGQGGHSKNEILTSELIYYYMIALGIPFECQKWHLARLLTLIEVCSRKNAPSKKMGKKATLQNYAALNRARRAKSHSRG